MQLVWGGAARRAAGMVAATLAATVALTATASATTTTLYGPADLDGYAGTGAGAYTLANTLDPSGNGYQVANPGVVTHWRVRVDCFGTCSGMRLAVLRPSSSGGFTVPAESGILPSSGVMPGGEGTVEFDTYLRVKMGDKLGIMFQDTLTSVMKATAGSAKRSNTLTGSAWSVGSSLLLNGSTNGELWLYNADISPLPKPDVTVTPSETNVVSGDSVTYTIHAASTEPLDTAVPSGNVHLSLGGDPLGGDCGTVTLVAGEGTCTAPATTLDGGTHEVKAEYEADDEFDAASGTAYLQIRSHSTATAVVAPSPVEQRGPVVYTAMLEGIAQPVSVQGGSAPDPTVAFAIDGVPVPLCGAQPLNELDAAACPNFAPAKVGQHTLTVTYSGDEWTIGSTDDVQFEVYGPIAALPATTDFGSATVGTAVARTVTLANDGSGTLDVADVALTGSDAFAITSNGCADAALAAGERCDVQLTMHPGSTGPYAATLQVTSDADGSPHSVALGGTGVAVAVPPPVSIPPVVPGPASTPAPAPVEGAVLAPGSKSTLSASVPAGSGTPSLNVPLSCPAEETCELDGTVTVATSTRSKAARAAASAKTTVARFAKVRIASGKVKTVKLQLSRSYVERAQKQGIRRIKATLTINTTLGSGRKVTTHQQVTVLLPKAAKKAVADKVTTPRFTG